MKASLTPLKSMLEEARIKQYAQDQLLFYADDNVTECFVLKSGVVKVFDIDSRGVEKVLHIVKPSAVLPFESFSSSLETVKWHYAALTDVEVYVFSPDSLLSQLTAVPELSSYILNSLATDNLELMRRIDGMSKTDAKDKVISILRFFSSHYAMPERQGWKRIEFPITHQLIADIAGITRESTTVQMGILQKEKTVRSRRPYTEVNIKRLA